MVKFHLVQINVAQAVADMDSAEMAGFINRLDEVNGLADQSDRFVWRLQEGGGNATNTQAYENVN